MKLREKLGVTLKLAKGAILAFSSLSFPGNVGERDWISTLYAVLKGPEAVSGLSTLHIPRLPSIYA